jgi:uncharacterized protein DUF2267
LSLDEFFERVADKEGRDLPAAVFHARAVVDVVRDAVGDDTVLKAVDQLPVESTSLVEWGSEGQLGEAERPLGSVSRQDWHGRQSD